MIILGDYPKMQSSVTLDSRISPEMIFSFISELSLQWKSSFDENSLLQMPKHLNCNFPWPRRMVWWLFYGTIHLRSRYDPHVDKHVKDSLIVQLCLCLLHIHRLSSAGSLFSNFVNSIRCERGWWQRDPRLVGVCRAPRDVMYGGTIESNLEVSLW